MNPAAAETGSSPRRAPDAGASADFLAGGGESGARMRAVDWSRTALGEPGQWPRSLKTIVRMMLDSRYAMWMLWGPELTFFCNDAYLPTVGIRRDWVMGARSDKVWAEIWADIGPRIDQVLTRGESTWDEAPAVVPGAQRISRGDLPHLLLQPGLRRRQPHRWNAVRGDRGHRAGAGRTWPRAAAWISDAGRRCASVQRVAGRLMAVLAEDLLDVPFASAVPDRRGSARPPPASRAFRPDAGTLRLARVSLRDADELGQLLARVCRRHRAGGRRTARSRRAGALAALGGSREPRDRRAGPGRHGCRSRACW